MNKATLLVIVATLLSCNSGNPLLQNREQPAEQPAGTHKADDAETVQALHDAYVTVYPLVLMEMARRSFAGVMRASANSTPWLNRFVHTSVYSGMAPQRVAEPDVDMVYSSAFTNVAAEPMVLHVPDQMGRYYMLLLVDDWGHVFNTAATPGAASFLITAPGWQGTVPAGMSHIAAPSANVWVAGRTQVNDRTDAVIVKSLLNRYSLTPLSRCEKGKQAADDSEITTAAGTAPEKLLLNMTLENVLQLANGLMQKTPPHWDAETRSRMAAVQVGPGKNFALPACNSQLKGVLAAIPAQVQQEMNIAVADSGSNGWRTIKPTLLQLLRSMGAGAGSNCVYMATGCDAAGKKLQGNNDYRLHIAKDRIPAGRAFWSITLYGKNHELISNNIERFAIGDRDKLLYNDDGSLDILIQHHAPAAAWQHNWLPAPEGLFTLSFRIYGVHSQSGTESAYMPAVEKVSDALASRSGTEARR